MLDVDAFKGYFLSHNAFVVRAVDSGHVMGVFYIKPNFPGRCSHICNGGFITEPAFRGRGVGTLMAKAFLWLARDIGYKASYFNLVFANNAASQALWDGLGFTRLAVVPKAGRLKGVDGLVDAIQYYYDLESLRDADNFLRTLSSEAEA
ncbi:acyl-CoA N-acyltransferase [Tribonema minus]|uniref:Acyl-CoA N-acyltransferase n=1 Tax=Tribonema minus TaxID=303371 RepID=A0A835ZBA6_9STRA|nr:acyl-CoA N-acyltransferase [Tribonema minus]